MDLMYTLEMQNEIATYETRESALRAARELSAERRHRKVVVQGPHGREVLTYAGGSLCAYQYRERARATPAERGGDADTAN